MSCGDYNGTNIWIRIYTVRYEWISWVVIIDCYHWYHFCSNFHSVNKIYDRFGWRPNKRCNTKRKLGELETTDHDDQMLFIEQLIGDCSYFSDNNCICHYVLIFPAII